MLGTIAAVGGKLLGGFLGDRAADKRNKQNIKMQKEFAQHGIRWKVEDAKAAGLHPLAALGAPTSSFAPTPVGGASLAEGVASAGQDISRAVDATRTSSEKVDAYTKTIRDLNVQRMGLENQLLSSQIAKVNQAGVAPPFPSATDPYLIEGQTQSGIKSKPHERVEPSVGKPWIEPGAITDTGFARTPTGWHPVMSKDVKERTEEDLIGSLLWNIRNRIAPSFGGSETPPNIKAPVGKEWFWNPNKFEYQLRDIPVYFEPRKTRYYPDHP